MGKELTEICIFQRKHCPDMQGWENNANLTERNKAEGKEILPDYGIEYF
jgi:hypothetical protein